MSQGVESYRNIETAIHNTRIDYYRISSKAREELTPCFDLFFAFYRLVEKWRIEKPEDMYFLEIGAVALRRIIASLVLLESGLILESVMIIRNVIEYLAILIDIGFNNNSLREWEQTSDKTIAEMSHEDWYFAFSKVIKRISRNDDGTYPPYETELAQILKEQWQVISNETLHAHSHAQIKPMISGPGELSLFSLLDEKAYQEHFMKYQSTMYILVTELKRNLRADDKLRMYHHTEEVQSFIKAYDEIFQGIKLRTTAPKE